MDGAGNRTTDETERRSRGRGQERQRPRQFEDMGKNDISGKQLVIAEKPSVAQAVARVIGADGRKDGYMEGNGYLVSWCVGHLVEPAPPGAYCGAWKKWSLESLPMIPGEWHTEVKAETAAQFQVLKKLMHDASVTEPKISILFI